MYIHRPDAGRKTVRAGRVVLLGTLLLTITLGTVIAYSAGKRQSVSGQIVTELYRKGDGGQWKVMDRLVAPANFEAVTYGSYAQTDFVWKGRTEQGCHLEVRWGGRNRYHLDVPGGLLEFEVPIEFTLNGKTLAVPVKCSTGSIRTPFSTLSGQRATIRDGSLYATVVGAGSFQAPSGLFRCSGGAQGRKSDEKETAHDSFFVVLKGEGRANSPDERRPGHEKGKPARRDG